MPIQLFGFERRDNADRDAFARAALENCRATRARDGIRSSRFYWHGPDTIVILTEGEAAALDAPVSPDGLKAAFALADLARVTTNWRLVDARTGEESYRAAGR